MGDILEIYRGYNGESDGKKWKMKWKLREYSDSR